MRRSPPRPGGARPGAVGRGRRRCRSADHRQPCAPERRPPRSRRRQRVRRLRGHLPPGPGSAPPGRRSRCPLFQSSGCRRPSRRKFSITPLAELRMLHLGMPLQRRRSDAAALERGHGRRVAGGQHVEALGAPARPSRRGSSTRSGRRAAPRRRCPSRGNRHRVAPYSLASLGNLPSNCCAITWKP